MVLSFNENKYSCQISITNNPTIRSHEFSTYGSFNITWDLHGEADTQIINASLSEMDTINLINNDSWQYSAYRKCHVIPPNFFSNTANINYEIKITLRIINYINRNRLLTRSSSYDSFTQEIYTPNKAMWRTFGTYASWRRWQITGAANCQPLGKIIQA